MLDSPLPHAAPARARHLLSAPRAVVHRYTALQDRHPRLVFAGAGLYLLAFTGWLVLSHTWPAPDVVAVGLLALALLSARGLSFLRDWTPFMALVLAYVALPGVVPGLAQRANVGFPIAVDRWLGAGELPTLRLQAWLWDGGRLHWYDYLAALLYLMHFIVPLAFAFLLWRWRRSLYWRFVRSYVLLIAAGLVTYVVFPMAPPWWASSLGRIPTVHQVLGDVAWHGVGNPVVLLSRFLQTDPVAAMPSIHAAFPVLVWLVTWRLWPRWGWAAVLYPLAMAFAVIYAGEHYLVDVLAGWLYAAAAYAVFWEAAPRRVWSRLLRALPARRQTHPVTRPVPVPVVAARSDEPRSPERRPYPAPYGGSQGVGRQRAGLEPVSNRRR